LLGAPHNRLVSAELHGTLNLVAGFQNPFRAHFMHN